MTKAMTKAMNKKRLLLAGRVALACAVLALCWLGSRRIEWRTVADALRGADLRLVALAAALNFLHIAAKSERWRVMLSPIARLHRLRLYYSLVVSYAASIVLPGRAGEALRVYLLKREVPAYASLGVIVVEKLFEGLGILLMVLPLPLLLPLPRWANVTIGLVCLAGLTGTLGTFWLATRAQGRLRAGVEAAPRWARFGAGLECVRRPSLFAAATGWSVVARGIDLFEVWLIFRAVGVGAPWPAAALVLLTLNIAIAVPSTPGQVGAFEAGAVAGLGAVGVPLAPALAFALVYHAMQVGPILLAGLVSLPAVARPESATAEPFSPAPPDASGR